MVPLSLLEPDSDPLESLELELESDSPVLEDPDDEVAPEPEVESAEPVPPVVLVVVVGSPTIPVDDSLPDDDGGAESSPQPAATSHTHIHRWSNCGEGRGTGGTIPVSRRARGGLAW